MELGVILNQVELFFIQAKINEKKFEVLDCWLPSIFKWNSTVEFVESKENGI